MFFTECASLAERHPDLAGVIQRIDARLQEMGTAEVIRPEEFASFLGVDLNQVTSVLGMLAQNDVLRSEEMVECPHCTMAVLRSDYEDELGEEGEFRCTDCDRLLPPAAVQVITTYRCGEKWKAPPAPKERPSAVEVAGSASAVLPRLGETPPEFMLSIDEFLPAFGKSRSWFFETKKRPGFPSPIGDRYDLVAVKTWCDENDVYCGPQAIPRIKPIWEKWLAGQYEKREQEKQDEAGRQHAYGFRDDE